MCYKIGNKTLSHINSLNLKKIAGNNNSPEDIVVFNLALELYSLAAQKCGKVCGIRMIYNFVSEFSSEFKYTFFSSQLQSFRRQGNCVKNF